MKGRPDSAGLREVMALESVVDQEALKEDNYADVLNTSSEEKRGADPIDIGGQNEMIVARKKVSGTRMVLPVTTVAMVMQKI